MLDSITIEMMSEDFLLWRCLHGGPVSRSSVEQPEAGSDVPRYRFRQRNVPLLTKLTRVYGACAVIARDGDRIVGQLRFYPRSLGPLCSTRCFCLQQAPPDGPSDDLVEAEFVPLTLLRDKTLLVHCIMTAPGQGCYQHKGLGTAMARRLIEWAEEQGWDAIEASAYEDLPSIYAVTGQTGRTFWLKLGFHIDHVQTEPELMKETSFVRQLRREAISSGIDPSTIANTYIMRREIQDERTATL